MNALGETTLVTDYIPRSRRQRGGQGPKWLPIAIEARQQIENHQSLRCRRMGYIYKSPTRPQTTVSGQLVRGECILRWVGGGGCGTEASARRVGMGRTTHVLRDVDAADAKKRDKTWRRARHGRSDPSST